MRRHRGAWHGKLCELRRGRGGGRSAGRGPASRRHRVPRREAAGQLRVWGLGPGAAVGGTAMKFVDLKAGILASGGAILASLCCLLPLVVVLLGLGSGAFMAVTLRYRPILLPLGIAGVSGGFWLYTRERKRCAAVGCRMAAGRLNLWLLTLAVVVLLAEVVLALFPDWSSRLLFSAMGQMR